MQADTLRANGVDAPIGTDMMPVGGQSYTDTNVNLDVVMFNHYNSKDNLRELCFWFDYIKNVKPGVPFWVTETDANYTGSNAAGNHFCPPRYTVVNSMLSYAMGGNANCYWLWRVHPAGQELMFGSVLTSQGRPHYNFGECKEISGYLKNAERFLLDTTVKNTGFAMTYSGKAWNMFEGRAIAEWNFNYQSQINNSYKMLFCSNLRPSGIDEKADFDLYKVIYSPFLPCIEEYGFFDRLVKWIKAGGIWIAGPLTDIRNKNGVKYIKSPTGHIEDLTGAYLKYSIPGNTIPADIEWNISDYSAAEKIQLWADGYEIPENCQNFGIYAGGPLKGLSASFFAPVGQNGGGIIVLGTNPPEKALAEMTTFAFTRRGLKKGPETSPNVLAVERVSENGADAGIIVVEIDHREGYVNLPRPMRNVMTNEEAPGRIVVEPYTVSFYE
jgi:beta-galactosidase GanA